MNISPALISLGITLSVLLLANLCVMIDVEEYIGFSNMMPDYCL